MFTAVIELISQILNFFRNLFKYRKDDRIQDTLYIKEATPSEIFLKRLENKFRESYDNKKVDWNENIDERMLSEISDEDKKTMENMWKSRIMTHYTPRGNVTMMYDIYNEGFKYYSDTSGIPYSVLNAMAMVYVLRFRCRDFFVDEATIPNGYSSPFIKKFHETEDEEQTKKKKYVQKMVHDSKSPFAKLKSRVPNKKEVLLFNDDSKMKNRFIHHGKLQNFKLTQEGYNIIQKKFNFRATYKSHKEKLNHFGHFGPTEFDVKF